MFRKKKTEALVVGAGPVGLFAALRLADRGVEVEIVDGQWRTTAHSYALALHPGSLALLDRVDLAEELIAKGHRVDTVAFYDGDRRRGEMRLGELAGPYPFVLVLPQQALEDAFEKRLRDHHVKIRWNHRLSKLELGRPVNATVDKLIKESSGYASASSGWVIGRSLDYRAAHIVGADGHRSVVRQALDIDFEALAKPQIFGVFEFDAEMEQTHELRVVLDGDTTNVLWPMGNNHFRWSFQLDESWLDVPRDRVKSRLFVEVGGDRFPFLSEESLEDLMAARAPWLEARVGGITWSVAVRFQPQLASSFGRDNVWLAGDSGHVTGPVGVQSMNVGLREADELAILISRLQRGSAASDLALTYDRERRAEWRSLLGLEGCLKLAPGGEAWVGERASRLLTCVPASGRDLRVLLGQIGLEMTP